MKHNKFCLIVCYFGKLPNYFQLWLNSCRYNSTVDFLLFTDDQYEYDYPNNVRVVYTTFSEVKKQIQDCFDFEICLEKPYKLCDYRPAFGLAFEKYIEKYEFWGHCDLDVIFGNINKYLESIEFKKYDRIYSQGHFTLYKNNTKTNQLFMEAFDEETKEPYYKKVFMSNGSYLFDEWAGVRKFYKNKSYNIYIDRNVIADISVKYKNLIPIFYDKNKRYVYEWKINNGTCELHAHSIENGAIQSQEFMYIHLQKRNMEYQLDDMNHFYIVPDKFINTSDHNIHNLIKKYTYIFPFYRSNFVKYKFTNLRKKIKNLFVKKEGLL